MGDRDYLFSTPAQTDLMCSGVGLPILSRDKAAGALAFATHPYPAPSLRMSSAIPIPRLGAFMICYGATFTFINHLTSALYLCVV